MHQPVDATPCRINPLDYLPFLKRRARRFLNLGVELQDLIQVGYFGLKRAAEKYDSDRGKAFHVYAGWWVDQTIKRAIQSQGSTVRIPHYIHDKTIKPGQNLAKREACDVAAARFQNKRAMAYFTPDARWDSEDEGHPLDVRSLPARGPSPAEECERRAELEELARGLDRLPERDARIIRLRFGIGCPPHTQGQVAAQFGYNRASLYEMEKRIITRLRVLITQDRRIGA